MPNLRIAASPNDILKIQKYRKYIEKIIRFALNLIQKALGAKILVEVPENLQDKDTEIFDAIATAHKMQSAGILGDIKKLEKIPDEPFLFRYVSSPVGIHASGSDFLNERTAFFKALGESAERYLWRNSNLFYRDELVCSSAKKLDDRTLDISTLAGFSQEQKEKNECLHFDKNTIFGWIPTKSLISGKKIYSPVQLFSARYFSEKVRTPRCMNKFEPMLRWSITTGLSTGSNFSHALAKGILEIVERDAFMMTYLNKISPPVVDLDDLLEQDKDLAKIVRQIRRYYLDLHVLKLPTDFGVEVFAAVIIDPTGEGPAFTIGASADFDTKTCILDAASEALAVRMSIKNTFRQPVDANRIDRMGRILYWAKGENLDKIEFLYSGEKMKIDLALPQNIFVTKHDPGKTEIDWKKALGNLVSRLKKKKYEAVFAELTTKEVAEAGFRCVRVVIPELQPMHLEEALPYLEGKRLHEVPERLGYEPANELNKYPHPFP